MNINWFVPITLPTGGGVVFKLKWLSINFKTIKININRCQKFHCKNYSLTRTAINNQFRQWHLSSLYIIIELCGLSLSVKQLCPVEVKYWVFLIWREWRIFLAEHASITHPRDRWSLKRYNSIFEWLRCFKENGKWYFFLVGAESLFLGKKQDRLQDQVCKRWLVLLNLTNLFSGVELMVLVFDHVKLLKKCIFYKKHIFF